MNNKENKIEKMSKGELEYYKTLSATEQEEHDHDKLTNNLLRQTKIDSFSYNKDGISFVMINKTWGEIIDIYYVVRRMCPSQLQTFHYTPLRFMR